MPDGERHASYGGSHGTGANTRVALNPAPREAAVPVSLFARLAAITLVIMLLHPRPVLGEDSAWIRGFAPHDETLPDDPVLREQLEKAIDLRRRERFDRVLDARDPGELVEHATLTEVDFDHRTLGIDTLFI